MGKPKSVSKKAKKLAKKKGIAVKQSNVDIDKYSVEDVLDKADEFIEQYNYEMAQKFLERALEINSDHPRALETAASLLLEAGEVEKAQQCLGRAITVQPNQGYQKYFSLAQLFSGQESLELFKQGIKIIEAASADITDLESEQSKETRKELASAFCAVAELYMTDLCDNPEAEHECSESVRKAIEADAKSPEAWQTKARLHLIKSEFEEAKNNLNQSLNLWLPTYQAVLENRPHEASQNFDPVEVCPLLYTTRLSTSRMLIELEEWEKSVQVLDGLIEEDDEIVDTWYLLGWVNKLRSEHDEDNIFIGNARYYLSKAKEVHTKNPTKDKEMINHINELLNEIGPEPDEEENGENDTDNLWEDLDDSDEEQEETNGMEQT